MDNYITYSKTTQLLFWEKVEKLDDDSCWNWLAFCKQSGHGQFWNGRKLMLAHRFSYELEFGVSAPDLLRHICNNPACVNPYHLIAGNRADNYADRSRPVPENVVVVKKVDQNEYRTKRIHLFWKKVNTHNGNPELCWEWLWGRNANGYGVFKFDGKYIATHRVSWMIVNGDIPEGLYVCHSCDNRLCVNPNHLWLGTHQDNMDDMFQKGRYKGGFKKGNKIRNYKYSEETYRKVIELRRDGLTHKEISEITGVSCSRVGDILSGKHKRDNI